MPGAWRPARAGCGPGTQLEQVGFDHVHDRIRLFADRGGDGIQADRPAVVFFDDGQQHAAVDIIQPALIDFEQIQRFAGNFGGDRPLARTWA